MGKTPIEWTERTWNPTRGCSRVSPGCVNCYAERIAARFSTHALQNGDEPAGVFAGFAESKPQPHWTGKVELIEDKLTEPLHWKKPCRVFVNSMSDLFHEALEVFQIAQVFAVMAYCQQHDFQVLTKRAQGMMEVLTARGVEGETFKHIVIALLQALLAEYGPPPHAKPFKWPLPNVWLGVSVENQKYADERIPLLLQTPAAVRFVSYEPALGPVDFFHIRVGNTQYSGNSLGAEGMEGPPIFNFQKIDWVIIGAESGPGARPFEEDWARSTRDQCVAAGTAFFYKQNARNGHKISTPELDGKRWMQFPEVACLKP